MTTLASLPLILACTFILTACGGDSADTTALSTTPVSTSTDSSSTTTTELSEDERAGLLFMREEEELARDLYSDIYAATDSRLQTFSNISNNAETDHAEAIRVLLEKYSLADPSTGQHNTYTDPELQALYHQLFSAAIGSDDLAAYQVGALVEETDIRDINEHKSHVAVNHNDIISTYDNLLCGSRNHLRAFAKQIEKITGQAYVTQVPELDTEVQAIVSSSQEKCN